MKDIKGLLFDADGTLLDTYGIILTSMRHTVNGIAGGNYGDDELMARVGTPLLDQMLHFANGDEDRAQELVDLYRKHNDGIHDENIRPFPDTKEALGMLSDAGFRMGVVTSKRHFMADRGLRMSGIAQYFDVLVASDDWPEHKPEPGPVLRGCELLGIPPEECAYIGDSPFDIQAGNSAGCFTVAALWGMFPAGELEACSPDMACTSLLEFARKATKLR